jgi:hypothetical protein
MFEYTRFIFKFHSFTVEHIPNMFEHIPRMSGQDAFVVLMIMDINLMTIYLCNLHSQNCEVK